MGDAVVSASDECGKGRWLMRSREMPVYWPLAGLRHFWSLIPHWMGITRRRWVATRNLIHNGCMVLIPPGAVEILVNAVRGASEAAAGPVRGPSFSGCDSFGRAAHGGRMRVRGRVFWVSRYPAGGRTQGGAKFANLHGRICA